MADPLFDLKTYFFLGAFQQAINEGLKIRPKDEATKVERDIWLYRSYIEQGNYQLVLDEIKNSAPVSLQAVRALASYFKGDPKESILTQVREWINDGEIGNNEDVQIIASILFYNEGSYEEALRALHANNRLDARSLIVQILLKVNRPELADKELKAMQRINEFAIPTQLSAAWIGIFLGGDRYQESTHIFQDLIDKYGPSVTLLNGLAVSNMHMKKHQDAEAVLLSALEKNSKSADTLVNLIVCSQHLNRPADNINRYINQLKSISPSHPWIQDLQKQEDSFETLSARFA